MALNSESPYVGDQAVQDLAGVSSPNVLRAVAPPERPSPEEAEGVATTGNLPSDYPEKIVELLGDYDPEGLKAFKDQVLGDSAPEAASASEPEPV